MNRNEEFRELIAQTAEPAADFGGAYRRAKRKNTARKVTKCGGWMAGFFACFVMLVNFCSPVAYACSQVPGLRELAEAVTFSRSLTDAVANEYVQPIELEQENNGITARVEYLIVDQKQVNVFFTLEGAGYDRFAADAEFALEDDGRIGACTYGTNEYSKTAGELRSASLECIDGDIPDKLLMKLRVYKTTGDVVEAVEAAPDKETGSGAEAELTPIAQFEFLLEFDPQFTQTGEIVEIGKSFVIDGQTLTVERVEIYPTHMRLELDDVPENTAWLKGLDFYILTDDGNVFESGSNGLVATGKQGSPMMASWRADSTYFYDAEHLKLVITGAEWLDKDMEWVCLDLADGTADRMPEGTKLYSAERTATGWHISIWAERREQNHTYQVFGGVYRSPLSSEDYCESWSIIEWRDDGSAGENSFIESFTINDYEWDEIWLKPVYSRTWKAETPIEIELK